jgi:ribosomal protein S18 acetylase RimI-like enzyme
VGFAVHRRRKLQPGGTERMIKIRRMKSSELERIAEVDRSEHVTHDYVCKDGSLELKEVDWRIPPWSADGLRANIKAWRPILDRGGVMLGAFVDGALVGFAIYRPHLSPGTAELAGLYVSNDYRRRGIGSALTREIMGLAKADDAQMLYVSSAPTAPTVEFYRSHGFELAQEPNQELYELEPEDIHMTRAL